MLMRYNRTISREKGYVYFQDFIPDNHTDTRVTIIGDRAFAFTRGVRPNDFRASGSGQIDYDMSKIDRRCVEIAFETVARLRTQSLAFDFVKEPSSRPKIVEISYCHLADAVYACPGHWDSSLAWHDGPMWSQDAILEDLFVTRTGRRAIERCRSPEGVCAMSRLIKSVFETVIIPPCRKVRTLRRLAHYVSRAVSEDGYHELRERFIANGRSGRWTVADRETIVRRFEEVERHVELGSTPSEGLIMAEALLSLEAPGEVIECGCFNGGSSAKLSIIAKTVGKKLMVFDSFEGLPEVDDFNKKDFNARKGAEWVTDWTSRPIRGTAGLRQGQHYAVRRDFGVQLPQGLVL